MKVKLARLMQLQKVDKELQALEALRGDLPQQVARMREQLEGLRQEHGSKEDTLTANGTSRSLLEGELKDFQDKLRKYRDQLYAVTSNREYDAITIEIESVEEKITETEDQILALLEQEDELKSAVAELGPEISELAEELETKEKELVQKIQATEVEFQSFQEQRVRLEASVEKRMIYQYNRIRKGLGNTVMADLKDDACSGCRSNIPPQRRVEIRMMDQLIFCESCGRILVSTSENAAIPS